MSKAEAARAFGMVATSVKRYVTRAQRGTSLEPGKAPGKESKSVHGDMKLQLFVSTLKAELTSSVQPPTSYSQLSTTEGGYIPRWVT